MNTRSLLVAFGVAGLLMVASSNYASAQEAIRIQPAIIGDGAGQVVAPGESFNSSIRVTNVSEITNTYSVFVQDIKDQIDGKPVFAEDSEDPVTGLKNWVSFRNTKITLGPNETKEVNFEIKVPENAFPGSHFGAIFISKGAVKPEEIGTGVGFQAGPVLIIKVPGDITEDALLREFSKDKGIYSSADVNFSLKIENMGNVLIRPRGPIDVYNMFGKRVNGESIVVNDEYASIFPKGERSFSINWKQDGFMFGRYDAVVALNYSDSRPSISGNLSFWIIPWHIILPIFGAIVFVVLLLVFGLRRYVERRVSELSGGQSMATKERRGLPFGKLMALTLLTITFTIVLLGLIFFVFG